MTWSPWQASDRITAQRLNEMVGDWESYTPTWTAATTSPVIGTGSLAGRWCRIGNLVAFSLQIQWGANTTNGVGNYSIGLPTTNATPYLTQVFAQAQNAGGRSPIIAMLGSNSDTFSIWGPTSTTSSAYAQLGGASTFLGSPWVSGSLIRVNGTYEAA